MIPRYTLPDGLQISRIVKGGWHLAGGHGAIDPLQAMRDMAAFVEAGITTFDCADIYNGVEQIIGDFRRAYPAHAAKLQIFTKFVPDLDDLPSVDPPYVERVVDRSLRRLRLQQLDAVQFHWWDFSVPGYVETALVLQRLKQRGKIARVSVTNWDTLHLAELVAAGVQVSSHQLQYSLLDHRPENGMLEFCRAHQIALLCYGTVAGGWLSDRWLGLPEPQHPAENRSLVKYKLIIDEFGGWPRFQALLQALHSIATKHAADIATIATAYILSRPAVAAAIVGATNASHLPAHLQLGRIPLDSEDHARLSLVLSQSSRLPGDVYALERDRSGKHGRIMKYNLGRS